MRSMAIPPFERRIDIGNYEFVVRSRLGQDVVIWPEQALRLVGYMGWPNDSDARVASLEILSNWFKGSDAIPPRLARIQRDWARVADIMNLHYDLSRGGHQAKRGGASIGKAVELAAAQTLQRGSGKANLWKSWTKYKDVAHLVSASTIIAAHAREMAKVQPFGEFGPGSARLQPVRIAMLLPDFVLSVGLWFQNYGLETVSQAREEPMLDPESLWRIPSDINVTPIEPPARAIGRGGIAILNARRAGNRGKMY